MQGAFNNIAQSSILTYLQSVKSFPPVPQAFRRHCYLSTLGPEALWGRKKLWWYPMWWPGAEKRWFMWKAKQRGAVEFSKIRNSDQRWLENLCYPKPLSPPRVSLHKLKERSRQKISKASMSLAGWMIWEYPCSCHLNSTCVLWFFKMLW